MPLMRKPSVVVIAHPYLFSSLIERVLRAYGGFDVEAPRLFSEDWDAARCADVVITSLRFGRHFGRVVVDLPEDFAHPVTVSIDELSVRVTVDAQRPLEGVADLLDRLQLHTDPAVSADTLLALAAGSGTRAG